MAEVGNNSTPDSGSEFGPPYVVDEYPNLLSRSLEYQWSDWLKEKPRMGFWAELDPIPREMALEYKRLVHRAKSFEVWGAETVRMDLTLQLEKKFSSEYLRFQIGDIEPNSAEDNGKLKGLYAEKWHRLFGNKPTAPEGRVIEVLPFKPVRPQSHLVYWLAEIDRRDSSFLAILVSNERQELGHRRVIEIIANGASVQVHLPVAAAVLDQDSPYLPTVIARAQYEGKFHEVARTQSDFF